MRENSFRRIMGEIRALRGLDPGKNFEQAQLPVEIDVSPAAAPATQDEPRRTRTEVGPKFTRETALQRTRGRGIPVNRAGVREAETEFDASVLASLGGRVCRCG